MSKQDRQGVRKASDIEQKYGLGQFMYSQNRRNQDLSKGISNLGDSLSAMADEMAAFAKGIFDMVYPVGSIYISVNATNPQTLFGGSWTQLENRFLLGAGSDYSNGATGGADSVSYTPEGTNTGTAITKAQMPSHSHDTTVKIKIASASNTGSGSTYQVYPGKEDGTIYNTSNPVTVSSGETGSGKTHTHTFTGTKATIKTMPPYLVVYMWKRTA